MDEKLLEASSKHQSEINDYQLQVTSLTEKLTSAQENIESLTKTHESDIAKIIVVLSNTSLTVGNSTNW